MKNLYTENYKIFLGEINKMNREICFVHWLKGFILLKLQCSPNWPIDSFFFFFEIDKLIFKIELKWKKHRTAKTTLKKKKVGRLILPDFKNYYKATVVKIV